MQIEFDPKKRAANLRKHGIDLADAQEVFEGVEVVAIDDRHEEERYLTIGVLHAREVVIAWTPRDRGDTEVRRVISMRFANASEIKWYWEEVE